MSAPETADEPSGATSHPTGGAGTGPKRDADQVEKRALTAHDAAEALSIPYRTLMAAIHKNQIGAVKIGRYYQVPVAEIERLLASAVKTTAA
jgi:excisionase family DNA binding protein